MEFETFVIIVAVALIFVFVSVASGRRHVARGGQRQCAACGAAHPPFAQFCRRCGQRLKE
jgi:predicted amidophosphoribosyltransferase